MGDCSGNQSRVKQARRELWLATERRLDARHFANERHRQLPRRRIKQKSNSAAGMCYTTTRYPTSGTSLPRDALTRFLDDGPLCLSNNAAERDAGALGRKNWTFAGSDDGGRRTAALYTLI